MAFLQWLIKKVERKPKTIHKGGQKKKIIIEPNSEPSIRTLKEKEEYVKSEEYLNLLADIEYLKERKETEAERLKEYRRQYAKVHPMNKYLREEELLRSERRTHRTVKRKPHKVTKRKTVKPSIKDKEKYLRRDITTITLQGTIIQRINKKILMN